MLASSVLLLLVFKRMFLVFLQAFWQLVSPSLRTYCTVAIYSERRIEFKGRHHHHDDIVFIKVCVALQSVRLYIRGPCDVCPMSVTHETSSTAECLPILLTVLKEYVAWRWIFVCHPALAWILEIRQLLH
jgi:hypothetical protein